MSEYISRGAVPHFRQEICSKNNRNLLHAVLILALAVSAYGCANTKPLASVSQLQASGTDLKIALMPLDVQLSLLTMGGVLEPQAEWTGQAEQFMTIALDRAQQARKIQMIQYQRPAQNDPASLKLNELEQLHGAVGQAILFHKYQVPLPTKKDIFDWTLGPDAAALREKTAADYALFIYVRDSYSSGGRVAFQIAASLFGIMIPGGIQLGFASLVDLRTGNVVWFNHLQDPAGDLRTEESATKTVEKLLRGLPN